MAIALGIDTGGTYTDAVLVEYESSRVLASAKALTTKRDLAVGIRQAMTKVLATYPTEVQLVSLSTTLATNAIVEGNGAPIAVLLLGYRERYDPHAQLATLLDTDRYVLVPGGHRSDGQSGSRWTWRQRARPSWSTRPRCPPMLSRAFLGRATRATNWPSSSWYES